MIVVPYDPLERDAYMACLASLARCSPRLPRVVTLVETHLRAQGLYWRAYRQHLNDRTDLGDGRPFSTDFAFTRFLVPFLPGLPPVALFCDSDFLWRADVNALLALADDRYAVQVVKHDFRPTAVRKMRGQPQAAYPRKCWSSLVIWNRTHPAHERLTLGDVNTRSGRDLHGFFWLEDEEIGDLPLEWNWLEGHSDPAIEPKAVHFTRGTPDHPGRADAAYANEYWLALGRVPGPLARQAAE